MEITTNAATPGTPGEEKARRLSEEIREVFSGDAAVITFEALLARISRKSFGVLLVILALPSALPLPAPGYAVPFGIALVVLAIQMIQLRPYPWFPQRVLRREIRTGQPAPTGNGKRWKRVRLVDGMIWFVSQFEKILRPRWSWLYEQRWFMRFLGLIVLVCAASMCTPVPLTNTGPALGIFLIGMGMLEQDGLFGVGGSMVGVAGVLLSITVIVLVALFGWVAVDMVKDVIRDVLPGISGDGALPTT